MKWTEEELDRATKLLATRRLEEASTCKGRDGCRREAKLKENDIPMCGFCSKHYLKNNPLYNRALNHAVRVAVDCQRTIRAV